MKYIYFHGKDEAVWWNDPKNKGLKEALPKIGELRKESVLDDHDVSSVSDEERWKHYSWALVCKERNKFQLRGVFGTGSFSGLFFAREIPALVVLDDSGRPITVYPHDRSGKYVTIADGLLRG